MTAPIVLEVIERGHKHPLALPIGPLPIQLGRANSAHCVLTDPAVAAQHLLLESDEATGLHARVLDTENGVWLGRKHLPQGTHFTWLPGQRLRMGHTVLMYRRANDPLPAEVPLQQAGGLHPAFGTVLALLTLALLSAWLHWRSATEAGLFVREWPQVFLMLLSLASGWALLWALLGRLLTGQLAFWRHVRIAALGIVAYLLIQLLTDALGFMFSWPALPRFGEEYMLLVLGVCLWAHLNAATHAGRGVLAAIVAALTIGALGVQLGLQWQSQKRLGTGLFMSSVLPPNWRLAPTQGIDAFVDAATQTIEQRLQRRLREDNDATVEELEFE